MTRSTRRAVLVQVHSRRSRDGEDLAELRELVGAAGFVPVAVVEAVRRVPAARFFLGVGKVEELRARVAAVGASAVVFSHELRPVQQYKLERALGCRVLERREVILEIFAQRARTYEGKLQVELAHLSHQATRLVRGWTHLERQRGGIGLRGGPGEQQLESDRRQLHVRLRRTRARLEKVRERRAQSRARRRASAVPVVSLVGYTNAGKSTLFNCLTGARVRVANQYFATLDPTLRKYFPHPELSVVLVDTVGFVRDLPPELVAAFRATLEETLEADLLLHVIDVNDPRHLERIGYVREFLEHIGAAAIPRLLVCNKIDLLPWPRAAPPPASGVGSECGVQVSAVTGAGLKELAARVSGMLRGAAVSPDGHGSAGRRAAPVSL